MTDYYCAFEAMNLDNMFADCHDLSTTRGGGLSVLKIGDAVAQKLDVEPISSSASQGLVRIPGESAEAVERRVREVLAGLPLLEYATLMVAACEAGDDEDGGFPKRIANLKTRMRWEQMRSPSVVYPKLAGELVCDIDRIRPATHHVAELKSKGKEHQSSFTYARRQYGRKQKKELLSEILGIPPENVGVVSDLNKLAEAPKGGFGNAAGKIAVLRFDGNDFGASAETCGGATTLKAFSSARSEEQKRFIRALIEPGISEWITSDGDLRLEVIVFGGDEVTVVTPAWLGWRALRTFYAEKQKSDMTYSGGVVFCHSNAPIHSIKKLAGELTDKAKDYAKDRTGAKGNFAAYQILESFDAIGRRLDNWMAERYPAAAGGVHKAILGFPEIRMIEQNMGYWKLAISKRKLYELSRAFTTGDRQWLDLDFHSLLKNLLESKGSPIDRLSKEIGLLHGILGNAAFLHILELWDYVGING